MLERYQGCRYSICIWQILFLLHWNESLFYTMFALFIHNWKCCIIIGLLRICNSCSKISSIQMINKKLHMVSDGRLSNFVKYFSLNRLQKFSFVIFVSDLI